MEGQLCFICCCPFQKGKYLRKKIEEKVIGFVVEILLELEAGQVLEETGGDGRRWRLCEVCGEKVKRAREIYVELLELVGRFRGIQEEIVKEARGKSGGGLGKRQKWRMTIDKRKDELDGDFVVRPLPVEDWRFVPSPPERGADFGGDSDKDEDEGSEVEVKQEIEMEADKYDEWVEGDDKQPGMDDKGNESDEEVDSDDNSKFSEQGEDNESSEQLSSSESDLEPAPKSKRKKITTKNRPSTEPSGSRLPGPKLFRIIEGDSVRFEPYRTHTLVKRLPSPEPKKKRRKRRHPSEMPPPKFNPLRQSCDICGLELPTAEIEAHVLQHVGSEYLRKCPNPQCSDCVESLEMGNAREVQLTTRKR